MPDLGKLPVGLALYETVKRGNGPLRNIKQQIGPT